MNLRDALLAEHSKAQTSRIVAYIGADRERFAAFMEILLHGDALIRQRAAWVLGWCGELQPALVEPYLPQLLELLAQPGHAAVRRNIVRALQFVPVPEDLQVRVFESCYELAVSLAEPPAVKAFALTAAANIARHEPDLLAELRLALARQMPDATPAFRCRLERGLGLPRPCRRPTQELNRWLTN